MCACLFFGCITKTTNVLLFLFSALICWLKFFYPLKIPTYTVGICLFWKRKHGWTGWHLPFGSEETCAAVGEAQRGVDTADGSKNLGETTTLPSKELTYPTLGKGKSSSKVPFFGDMLVPWRVYLIKTLWQIGKDGRFWILLLITAAEFSEL